MHAHAQGGAQGNANIGVTSRKAGRRLKEKDHKENRLQRDYVSAIGNIDHLTASSKVFETVALLLTHHPILGSDSIN